MGSCNVLGAWGQGDAQQRKMLKLGDAGDGVIPWRAVLGLGAMLWGDARGRGGAQDKGMPKLGLKWGDAMP